MKKAISILILPLMIVGALCIDLFFDKVYPDQEPKTYDTGYDEGHSAGYNLGHDEGYEEGYRNGHDNAMEEASDKIESYIESDISDLKFDILVGCEMHPEEAVRVLTNYIDGEPIPDVDLNHAIEAIRQYYYGLDKIVSDVDDYLLE